MSGNEPKAPNPKRTAMFYGTPSGVPADTQPLIQEPTLAKPGYPESVLEREHAPSFESVYPSERPPARNPDFSEHDMSFSPQLTDPVIGTLEDSHFPHDVAASAQSEWERARAVTTESGEAVGPVPLPYVGAGLEPPQLLAPNPMLSSRPPKQSWETDPTASWGGKAATVDVPAFIAPPNSQQRRSDPQRGNDPHGSLDHLKTPELQRNTDPLVTDPQRNSDFQRNSGFPGAPKSIFQDTDPFPTSISGQEVMLQSEIASGAWRRPTKPVADNRSPSAASKKLSPTMKVGLIAIGSVTAIALLIWATWSPSAEVGQATETPTQGATNPDQVVGQNPPATPDKSNDVVPSPTTNTVVPSPTANTVAPGTNTNAPVQNPAETETPAAVQSDVPSAATPAQLAEITRLRGEIEVHPDDHHLWVDFAEVLLAAGQPQDALPWIDRAVRRRPQRGSYRVLQGDILARMGQRARAINAYREALRTEPSRSDLRERIAELQAAN